MRGQRGSLKSETQRCQWAVHGAGKKRQRCSGTYHAASTGPVWQSTAEFAYRWKCRPPPPPPVPQPPILGAPPPPCNSHTLVQATVGAGTVLIWDFCVAITRGRGGTDEPNFFLRFMLSALLYTRAIAQSSFPGRSRSPCLARAACCAPLQSCCFLVGVLPTGHLCVPLFVTERYLWSFRPLTSHFLPVLCADHLLCARAIAQASSVSCKGGSRV